MHRPPLFAALFAIVLSSACSFDSSADLGAQEGPGPGPDAGVADGSSPDPDAAPELCGNGELDAEEECDDGNGSAGDGCSKTCKVEPGYVCEALSCKKAEVLAVVAPFEFVGAIFNADITPESLEAVRCEDEDEVLVGFRGHLDGEGRIVGLAGLCAEPSLGFQGKVDWEQSSTTQTIGNGGNTTDESSCAQNELMVGIELTHNDGRATLVVPLCSAVQVVDGEIKVAAAAAADGVGPGGGDLTEHPCADGRAVGSALGGKSEVSGLGGLAAVAVVCGDLQVVLDE